MPLPCCLLTHPEALVRREAIVRTETLCLKSAETTIRQLVQHEPDLLTRAAAVRAVARCASEDAIHDLLPLVAAQEPALQQAALIGLLHSGNLSAARQALDRLHSLAGGNPTERQQVAAVIAQVGTPNLQHLLQPLLTDSRSSVRRATLLAAQHYPALQDNLLAQLTNVHSGTAAQSALVTQGAAVLPKLQQRFAASVDTDEQRALVDVIGRIGTPQTHDWLLAQLANPLGKLRSHTLRALYRLQPAIDEPQRERLKTILVDEAARAAEVVAALNRLRTLAAPQLSRGLSGLLDSIRDRILDLLALVYPDAPVAQIRENLRHPLPSQQAYAIELLDVALPPKLKRRVLHVLRPALPSEPVSAVDAPTLLGQLAFEHREPFTEWIQICALYAIGKLGEQRFLPQLDELLSAENRLISETARWSASQLAPSSTHAIGLLTMLLTIEKVIILRSVDLFASTPDETLVQVAGLLDEVTLEAGATIFEKGDMGDSMYIIVNGKVRVHDGEQTLNYLEDRSVFGEMALLDPEPRVASISAETPTLLLKLDQEPFSELLDTRPEVSRGIIRVLSRHLRERVRDLNTLRQ